MCFSATSSFVVASGLTIAGVVAIKKAPKDTMIPLALIPLGFAAQQAAEGIVWLTLDQPTSLIHKCGMYCFLFFAYAIWPLWIPFAIRMYENNYTRKLLLSLIQIVGLLFAITATFVLATTSVTTTVIGGHMAYTIGHFLFSHESSLAWYIIPTIFPFFVASNRHVLKLVGILLTLSLTVTYFFARETLPSVWCFFAAVISLGVLGVIWNERKSS